MAAPTNTIKKADVVAALDAEVIKNFRGEYDQLVDALGLFNIDKVAAGTGLYQYTVTGSLSNTSTDNDSSGTSYVEGDKISLSKYAVAKSPIGDVEFVPYAKQTTAQAILKGGFENAIYRTDKKAIQQMRAAIMNAFFTFLANGTTSAAPTSGSWNLQATLAHTEAALLDAMEDADEAGGSIVHFVNRGDAYSYLASQTVSTQEMFGMTYLENFLGVQNVLLTNKVSSGTVYATPAENIHIYGIDYDALGDTGLVYQSDDLGLIGVAHEANYDYASAVTYLVRSANFIPEYLTFIAKGFMAPVVTTTTTTTGA